MTDDDPKSAIREQAKQYRDRLEVNPEWADQAAAHFFDFVKIPAGAVVSAYYPIGKEMDPLSIVERLWAEGVEVCLPVINPEDRELSFSSWDKDTPLLVGPLGIPAPVAGGKIVEPDILIVPLLAFDQRGNRIGYGKGNYDATLRALRAKKDILAVGLAYAEQACLLALPSDEYDEKLDLVVTPQRVFDFRGYSA
jgi:5-formyltetrahydrofolate cyclo-ligase